MARPIRNAINVYVARKTLAKAVVLSLPSNTEVSVELFGPDNAADVAYILLLLVAQACSSVPEETKAITAILARYGQKPDGDKMTATARNVPLPPFEEDDIPF